MHSPSSPQPKGLLIRDFKDLKLVRRELEARARQEAERLAALAAIAARIKAEKELFSRAVASTRCWVASEIRYCSARPLSTMLAVVRETSAMRAMSSMVKRVYELIAGNFSNNEAAACRLRRQHAAARESYCVT